MNTRKPGITFYANGKIDIAAQTAKALALSQGDVIDILHKDGEVLLYCKYRHKDTANAHRNVCHATHRYVRRAGTLRVWSKAITRQFLHGDMKRAYPVGTPVETHCGTAAPIIVSFALNR